MEPSTSIGFYVVTVANCLVDVLAYSAYTKCDPRRHYGWVKLNTVAVWQASWCGNFSNIRGVTILQIDPFTCMKEESRNFDTHDSSAATRQLSTYLEQVNETSVVVGVTADEPVNKLFGAFPTLEQFGVDVADVHLR